MQSLRSFLKSPLHQCAAFLGIYALCAWGWNYDSVAIARHATVILGTVFIGHYALRRVTGIRILGVNLVISTIIFFLLLDPGGSTVFEQWIVPFLGSVFLLIAHYGLRYKHAPIFNPATAALLLLFLLRLLLGEDILLASWWGASFGGYFALSLLWLWVVFGVHRWRRLTIVLTFLVCNVPLLALEFFLKGEINELLPFLRFLYLDATIYFLAAIMLLEPKTSPAKTHHQIIYALIAVLIYRGLTFFHVDMAELFAIAGANMFHMLQKTLPKQKYNKTTSAS